jgi:hypothetical protein
MVTLANPHNEPLFDDAVKPIEQSNQTPEECEAEARHRGLNELVAEAENLGMY